MVPKNTILKLWAALAPKVSVEMKGYMSCQAKKRHRRNLNAYK